MNKKRKLGRVVKNLEGFNIRTELKKNDQTEVDRFGNKKIVGSINSDSGTFGIYAGKKLVKGGFKTVDDAVSSIL